MKKATFAAGCFWGVEESFRELQGVLSTRVGYTGGSTRDPTYLDVCSDTTGHAEAVEITYDPSIVSYLDLLRTFFNIHDPTSLNRQGPDIGSQYRSAIFYHDREQEGLAAAAIKALESSGKYGKYIITALEPAGDFYAAEEYHQQYLLKRGLSSCGR